MAVGFKCGGSLKPRCYNHAAELLRLCDKNPRPADFAEKKFIP
jgi:hypothetical protein